MLDVCVTPPPLTRSEAWVDDVQVAPDPQISGRCMHVRPASLVE